MLLSLLLKPLLLLPIFLCLQHIQSLIGFPLIFQQLLFSALLDLLIHLLRPLSFLLLPLCHFFSLEHLLLSFFLEPASLVLCSPLFFHEFIPLSLQNPLLLLLRMSDLLLGYLSRLLSFLLLLFSLYLQFTLSLRISSIQFLPSL